jgi:hypothetical protein
MTWRRRRRRNTRCTPPDPHPQASTSSPQPTSTAQYRTTRSTRSPHLHRTPRAPAHLNPIHFFISADGHRKLTTQINIDGDEYLHDDFAFATRDGLIPAVRRSTDEAVINAHGLNAPFAEITFDFVLHAEQDAAPTSVVQREHAPA